jgi:uncharacterized Ntn-hydrolase superfamily protein
MKKLIIFLLTAFYFCNSSMAQNFSDEPFAHTFSIVARDSVTGEMGVAVQSHAFSVGTVVTWGDAGVGVVATQATVKRTFGPDGLKLLKEGKSPEEVVKILTEADSGRDNRQLGVLDMQGRTASYTGNKCIAFAGNIAENNFAVQANMMLNDKVVPAMTKAFKETKGALAERMIAAMEAGQNAGGDVRGQQSAAILIVNPVATGLIWKDRNIDLRVEDNPEPIKELKRLLQVFRAWEHANAGDEATEKNDLITEAKEYGIVETLIPNNAEIKFWHAVTLVNNHKTKEALPLFKTVFEMDNNWLLLFSRLRKADILTCDAETEKIILSLTNK